ncbi:hypothetical protein ACFW2V_37835 [Streptomyces sp. NPDC058947]
MAAHLAHRTPPALPHRLAPPGHRGVLIPITISLLPAAAAPSIEVHGGTFIGHDINGWTVAMICAIIAAYIYEMTMALLRKVPLRIPFVVLQFARMQVPKAYRSELYQS